MSAHAKKQHEKNKKARNKDKGERSGKPEQPSYKEVEMRKPQ